MPILVEVVLLVFAMAFSSYWFPPHTIAIWHSNTVDTFHSSFGFDTPLLAAQIGV